MSTLIEVDNLNRHFGGVKAVRDISFSVQNGQVYSIIGPNGAGKTTLFNLMSGIYVPTSGAVKLDGEPVGGMAPELLARRGVSRTFQNLQLCMNMSAAENVMIGAHLRLNTSMLAGVLNLPALRRAERTCREEAEHWMHFAGVDRYIDSASSQMPYGALKRLEIARALMSRPRLIYLDEPAAGLNHSETFEIEELVRKVASSGVTVMLIEHDMKLVMAVSDRILVMHHGARLYEGTPAEVKAHPDVIAAYLGTDIEALTEVGARP
jgi:branched-chain amino acid transport system ATP-binding protein